MNTVHLICGVPGAGKTWIATQLGQFAYLPHDDYPVAEYHAHLTNAAAKSDQAVLAEAPFRISILIESLRLNGVPVVTYYISEPEHVIKARYERRMGKAFPKQHSSNLRRYEEREWDYRGTAKEILETLMRVK